MILNTAAAVQHEVVQEKTTRNFSYVMELSMTFIAAYTSYGFRLRKSVTTSKTQCICYYKLSKSLDDGDR